MNGHFRENHYCLRSVRANVSKQHFDSLTKLVQSSKSLLFLVKEELDRILKKEPLQVVHTKQDNYDINTFSAALLFDNIQAE